MKIILDEKICNEIWDKINNDYKFCPSINKEVRPFEFDVEYVCYQLKSYWNIEQENMVNNIFKNLSDKNIYALDWKHDCFEYNPNENIEYQYHYHDDNRNVEVYFPSYYPDGDYYFFISKDWDYGMFGHPWRKELYIFGKQLINEFKKVENELDIEKNRNILNKFSITANELKWINNKKDNPNDLCLHGHAIAKIGNETFEYNATVSATALYLLKSIEEDHIIYNDIQMLPCCGFSMWLKEDNTGDVFICGCPNGIDWNIIHEGENVKLITETGKETIIDIKEYKKEVFKFADLIEEFYNKSTPKILPEDEMDKQGYIGFWKEWHRRRNS